MQTFIISAEKKIYEGAVHSLNLPGVDGSFEILQNHAPMFALLGEGIIKIVPKDYPMDSNPKFEVQKEDYLEFFIKKGILEINQNKIIILI